MGSLYAQLLLQFYADSFEILQTFWSLSDDVHMYVLDIIPRLFIVFLLQPFRYLLLSKGPVRILCTLCAQLLLPFYSDSFEICRCICHGFRFLYNSQINLSLFPGCELRHSMLSMSF